MTTPDPFATPPPPAATPPPPGMTPPPPGMTPPPGPAGAGPSSEPPVPGGAPVSSPPAAPDQTRPAASGQQPAIVIGVILIVLGAVFLAGQLIDVAFGPDQWPLWIVVPGVVMFLASFAIPPRGGLGLAIPGAIVTIVGLILWVQETYDLYATWAYAWALVAPTGPGIAMLAYGLVKGDRELANDGLRTTLVGLALFVGFALFFEGVIGLSGSRIAGLDQVLPFIAIGLGVVLVVLSLFGRRERSDSA